LQQISEPSVSEIEAHCWLEGRKIECEQLQLARRQQAAEAEHQRMRAEKARRQAPPAKEAQHVSQAATPLVAQAEAGKSSEVVLRYILNELGKTGWGVAGLTIAGVMAAGPAGINSGLNSMASTFVTDVYRPARPGRDEHHYVRVSRLAVVVWGLILGAFAMVCIGWFEASKSTIIEFVLGVMNFAYAGLLGVFFTALFTKRGNTASAIAALIVGAATVLAVRPELWTWVLAERTGNADAVLAFKLAWPWQLVAGTIAATVVCCAGRPSATRI
jgi:Na+/proline symporter